MTTRADGRKILVVGVGGLGRAVVEEALDRGAEVSVLVRDPDKLARSVDVRRLAAVTVGDGTDPATLDRAVAGVDVVVSGNGAHKRMAREIARAVKRNGVQKLIWPAGGTNAFADDGVTPAYKLHEGRFPGARDIYLAHQGCIDAIRQVGVNHVIWAPGRMTARGARSRDIEVKVDRSAGMYVSYEDAAWVIVEAAVTDAWDGHLVSAATQTGG
ncbi:NAD(P)-dependent oxidoreductase [Corynebacterium frankenforstense]|uniref:NAD(P)-dependent oxidoreductase n=1 Tax=Corynebacterium frankenforstense TaxID=1230998 RepID=UPI0009F99983|nr:NAD(P)H-binding protein [Corynebacterium frankenforstense]